ncbi:MAG: glycosyltransferase family 4 protein [Mariprofundaceae bacterium]|nr:glycosyltransferase family 4 protein [Mariprofundaceae bacterium]
MGKVVYVSQFDGFVGGGEHSLLTLMQNIPDLYSPVLITPRAGAFSLKAGASGIRTDTLPMPPVGLKSFMALKQWGEWLKLEKPGLIHANNSRAAFYAGIAGKKLGIPVIFHCRIAEKDPLMDSILMYLVSAVICNSHSVAERFESSRLPVCVIYNGIEPPAPASVAKLPDESERLVLFVGRISREKQLEMALEAFARLSGLDSGLHMAIVGAEADGHEAYADDLKRLCSESDWGPRVHWVGEQEDVARWYKVADLLILTSKHEGFGRVLVEAMAYAVPVVAFNVGGVPEVVENGVQGLLVEAGDVDGLVESCRSILDDPEQHQKMGEAGIIRANEFSVRSHVDQVCELYQRLTSGKAA